MGSACCPTPPPLPKHGPVLTTSSISCTPSVPLFTGTSVKVWKKVNSPKPVKISAPSRRTTKKSVSTLPMVEAKTVELNKTIRLVNPFQAVDVCDPIQQQQIILQRLVLWCLFVFVC